MEIGKIGVSAKVLNWVPIVEAQKVARLLEDFGYGAVWMSEELGNEVFTHVGLLLAGSRRIVIGTGIANIWARDAVAMSAAHKTLSLGYPDRFILGLGVSHADLVRIRGHDYQRPFSTMRAYLDAMDAAPFEALEPSSRPVRVLAALGPRMLKLAAARTNGAYPYLVPVEHTAMTRDLLGDGPLLIVEQPVIVETNHNRARKMARDHNGIYMKRPNYRNNLLRLGFREAELDSSSDRLIDAVIAWGDEDAIAERIAAHHQAGANHVVLQLITGNPRKVPIHEWERLAVKFSLPTT